MGVLFQIVKQHSEADRFAGQNEIAAGSASILSTQPLQFFRPRFLPGTDNRDDVGSVVERDSSESVLRFDLWERF